MSFYEKLEKQILTKGHCVVQDKDGDYCVFSHFMDEGGDYRCSSWWDTIKIAKEHIGCFDGNSKEYIEKISQEQNWKIIESFEIPLQRFKEGDKVVIAKNARELCEKHSLAWDVQMEEIIGKVCEIKGYYGLYYNVLDKTSIWSLPHSALSYPIEETDDKTEEAINLLKKAGYKIIKE